MEEQRGIEITYPMLPTPVITYNMVHKLDCTQDRKIAVPSGPESSRTATEISSPLDTLATGEPKATEKFVWKSPIQMIVFDGGDLNSAMHHVVTSLQNPFAENAVATLFIQESVRSQFLKRLVDRMKPLDPLVANHPSYVRTLAKVQKLKAETVVGNPETVPADATPMLVCDLKHNFLGDGPTGVITLHTFRTAKEATVLNLKETLVYGSVSIWDEKLASAYEVCALLKNDKFMINCFNVDLAPIIPAFNNNTNDVKIVKGYHYETVTINQKRKIIVFAVGTIFAN